jgi:hypothetical protein
MDEQAIRALLFSLSWLLLGATLPKLLDHGFRRVDTNVVALAGTVLLLTWIFWPQIAPVLGTTLVSSMVQAANDFRVWLVLFLLLFVYAAITNVTLLRQRDRYADVVEKDILPFRLALEKWVLPRRLTPEQIESIGAYLEKYSAHTINFKVKQDDEEASVYRGDIQRAVGGRGGWMVGEINYSSDVRQGLTIDYQQTQVTQQLGDDPRQPKPDRLLTEALRQANVKVDGSSSGGSGGTQDVLSICVGARRRDNRADPQKWPS